MAVCLDCKADYIRGITVCPACGRALEPDPPPEPEPSADFVPLFNAGFPAAIAARATLEAAGLETRIQSQDHLVAYSPTPFHMTILVRERDLPIARNILRL
ncbi:MAG TPA: hypothetical protein VGK61_05950 [Planctomycetota bacterium]|jgi:hypothetical protein